MFTQIVKKPVWLALGIFSYDLFRFRYKYRKIAIASAASIATLVEKGVAFLATFFSLLFLELPLMAEESVEDCSM